MSHAPSTWNVLTEDDPTSVVLACDFDATGRAEARFTDFVAHLGTGLTVWETVPQAVATRPDLPAEAYVKQWTDEVRASGRRVRAVLGFCAGSVYAAAVAREIEALQGGFPLTVLFDPERASAASMYWQFHKAVGQMAPTVGAAETGFAQDAGQRAQEDSRDLADLARQLLVLYHAVAAKAFDKLGIDAARRSELTETAGAFLSYLATAEQIEPMPVWGRSTVITSATPTSGLNALRALNPGRYDEVAAQELRFDVAHVDLLRTPAIGTAVAALIRDRT
ncbi:hypothetical protein ACIRQQ_48900 [Streptomyces fuscichromogenes]|uniref:hypothetical protein n=1 Tax=Streptomyces fuscichromogenes TaxID=1324013 RepID=UPI0038103446